MISPANSLDYSEGSSKVRSLLQATKIPPDNHNPFFMVGCQEEFRP